MKSTLTKGLKCNVCNKSIIGFTAYGFEIWDIKKWLEKKLKSINGKSIANVKVTERERDQPGRENRGR